MTIKHTRDHIKTIYLMDMGPQFVNVEISKGCGRMEKEMDMGILIIMMETSM